MVHEMNDISAGTLGAELKTLRLSHGYTQVDVAVAVDIAQPSYFDMEKGKTKPSLGTLYRLAAYYYISVDDILRHCINLDDEMLFNTNASKDKNKEEADYLSFIHKEIMRLWHHWNKKCFSNSINSVSMIRMRCSLMPTLN